MANTFKNSWSEAVPTSQTDVYTTPSATTSILIGLTLSNSSGSDITATVELFDSSVGNSITFLNAVSIPKNTALEVMRGNKINLEAGDKVQVTAGTVSSLNAFASILEIT